MAEERPIALFAGSVNPGLADDISKELGVSLGNVKLEKFANGEIYARYQESVRGKEVFLVQSVCCGNGLDVNDALMELLIMADAAKRASAHNVSAVITHYGYARQDRKAAPREPITAKLVADLLQASGVDNVITIDLHQDAIQGFFDIRGRKARLERTVGAHNPSARRRTALIATYSPFPMRVIND